MEEKVDIQKLHNLIKDIQNKNWKAYTDLSLIHIQMCIRDRRVAVSGRIQTGSYTNKDGVKVYTTEVLIEEHEFAQSKSENQQNQSQNTGPAPEGSGDGFMNIPDGINEQLPFD